MGSPALRDNSAIQGPVALITARGANAKRATIQDIPGLHAHDPGFGQRVFHCFDTIGYNRPRVGRA